MVIEEKFGSITIYAQKEEKEIVINKIKEIFDKKFSDKKYMLLYYYPGNEMDEDEYFHKNLGPRIIKKIFSEISNLYDMFNFDSIQIENRKDEFKIIFWVPQGSHAHNGHSVGFRYCPTEDFNSVKKEISKLECSEVIKNFYLYYLNNISFTPSLEIIKSLAIDKLKSFFSDIICSIEYELEEYMSLKDNDIINKIIEAIDEIEDNDEEKKVYLMFSENIEMKYYSDDILKIYLEEKILIGTYKRTIKTEYFLDFE